MPKTSASRRTNSRARPSAPNSKLRNRKLAPFARNPRCANCRPTGTATSGGRYKRSTTSKPDCRRKNCATITATLTTYPGKLSYSSEGQKAARTARRNGCTANAPWITAWPKRWRSASLVKAGVPVRLTGQDTRRGTFNQRHSVLLGYRKRARSTCRCSTFAPGQARCEIYNSTLSEAGVLGFEYGYSRDYPEALVLWEAQFGDFANVAQASHRSVHQRRRRQMGPAFRRGDAAAARLRRPGPGTFQRPHRAFPAARGARQHSDLPAVERGAVFPSVAPAGAAALAQTAGRIHAQEHAAASRRFFAASRTSPSRTSCNVLPDMRSRQRQAHPALHRKNRPRVTR